MGEEGQWRPVRIEPIFTAAVGLLLLWSISSNAFMLIGAGMMYGSDTKNTHAFKIVKLLEISSPLWWVGNNVHIFTRMPWKSQPTYATESLGSLCPSSASDNTSKPLA